MAGAEGLGIPGHCHQVHHLIHRLGVELESDDKQMPQGLPGDQEEGEVSSSSGS